MVFFCLFWLFVCFLSVSDEDHFNALRVTADLQCDLLAKTNVTNQTPNTKYFWKHRFRRLLRAAVYI